MIIRDFEVIQPLGQGSYGAVYLAKRLSDETMCALKVIDVRELNKKQRKDTLNEIRLLASVRHENILRYYQSFVDHGHLHIATEYVDKGDLEAEIKMRKLGLEYFEEWHIWKYYIQISLALRVLHHERIIHRDLKSANILLTSDGRAKLADFGVARSLKSKDDMAKTRIGTPYYLSPEVWRGQPYNYASDIWALGVILYEMIALRYPFDGSNVKELAKKVVKGNFKEIDRPVHEELISTVETLLVLDPTSRPTAEQILKAPCVYEKLPVVWAEFGYEGTIEDELMLTTYDRWKLGESRFSLENTPHDENEYPPDDYFTKDNPDDTSKAIPEPSLYKKPQEALMDSDRHVNTLVMENVNMSEYPGTQDVPTQGSVPERSRSPNITRSTQLDANRHSPVLSQNVSLSTMDFKSNLLRRKFHKPLGNLVDSGSASLSMSTLHPDGSTYRKTVAQNIHFPEAGESPAYYANESESAFSSTNKAVTHRPFWQTQMKFTDAGDGYSDSRFESRDDSQDEHQILPKLATKTTDKPVPWILKEKKIWPHEIIANADSESARSLIKKQSHPNPISIPVDRFPRTIEPVPNSFSKFAPLPDISPSTNTPTRATGQNTPSPTDPDPQFPNKETDHPH